MPATVRSGHDLGREMNKTIVVMGSLNMDFTVQMEKLPVPGETVGGWGFRMLPGGKGANQACAVGRLGGQGKMVGRVGEDVFGVQLLESLQSAGVDTVHVLTTSGETTGVALIFVERNGQNQIVVASGANARLNPEDVSAILEAIPARFLLLQLESPLETVEAAASFGRSRGIATILDPAPARPLNSGLLSLVDFLTPNESEALMILGRSGSSISLLEAPQIARELLSLGPGKVVLKLGANGAWLADAGCSRHFPAPKVEAVDVTAAGDTFNGALAVALAEGKPIEEAIHFANTAASLAVTRFGAQSSIPVRKEVEAWLRVQSGSQPNT